MQDESYDVEGRDNEEQRAPLRTSGASDTFDLAALRLSPLGSPAMTTVPSGSGPLSMMSDRLSLATDDKEDGGEDEGAGSNKEEKNEERAEQSCGDAEEEQEVKDGREEETEQKEREDAAEAGKRIAVEEGKQDKLHAGEDDEPLATVDSSMGGLINTPASLVPALPRLSSRDCGSDDDMTVECASPRDPLELDDAIEAPSREREIHVTPVSERGPRPNETILHPLSSTHESESVSAVSPAPPVVYSLKTLFPVVYESPNASRTRGKTTITPEDIPDVTKKSSDRPRPAKAVRSRQAKVKPLDGTESRGKKNLVSPLESEETQRDTVQIVTKALHLQLQVAESDRKQLAQRNARLKAQLSVLTADLIRTKADAAKWKTENELYAAKMPRLQAELSEETTQVDEKQAQSIQSQLEITQLRAKLQVLQTRAGNLDSQVERLQNELRTVKKDARRRAITQQQSDEKMKRLETELHDAKASHAHELLLSKQKLTAAVQRLDHERVKREAEFKKIHLQQLDELRATLAKATKKWKDLEHGYASREEELAVMKKRVEDTDEEARSRERQTKTSEMLLAHAERTEASLRSQLATLKVQLKSAQRETSKALRTSTTPRQLRPRPTSRQVVTPLSSPPRRPASKCGEQPGPLLCSCCQMVLDSLNKADQIDIDDGDDAVHGLELEPRNTPADCTRCHALEAAVCSAQDELTQLRALHNNELKVQATAYERVISTFRRAANPSPSPQCA